MKETIFWWVFTLASVFVFFFSYGMVEDLIRKWVSGHPKAGRQLAERKAQYRTV